jgi:hypothetical protein
MRFQKRLLSAQSIVPTRKKERKGVAQGTSVIHVCSLSVRNNELRWTTSREDIHQKGERIVDFLSASMQS